MSLRTLIVLIAVAASPSLGFCLSAEYPSQGERLKSVLCADEGRLEAPAGYAKLVDRTELLGGYFVNYTDAFFYSGDKQSLERFLEDYASITNVVAHTIILRFKTIPGGPPLAPTKFSNADWALHFHRYGVIENQRPIPKDSFVLWVELHIGGKIAHHDMELLKIPAGMQVLYVTGDSQPVAATKEKENP